MELQGKFSAVLVCCVSREAAQDSGILYPCVMLCPELLVAFQSTWNLGVFWFCIIYANYHL